LVRFRIGGLLRFLSHAEAMEVFRRAFARAAEAAGDERSWSAVYSEGFNPRVRLSLPLPRSVGVESDDELVTLRVRLGESADGRQVCFDSQGFTAELTRQLPGGMRISSVTAAEAGTKVWPRSATYVFEIDCPKAGPEQKNKADRRGYLKEKLQDVVGHIFEQENLWFERPGVRRGVRARTVDVRPFINSVELDDSDPNRIRVIACCVVTPTGTIRVDEIGKLLALEPESLAGAVRRAEVDWQISA